MQRNSNYRFNLMEQAKFRTLPTNSRQKIHILNKLNKPNFRTQQHKANNSTHSFNFDTDVRKERLTDITGRESGLKKKTLAKNAKAELLNSHLSKETLKQLRKVHTQQSQPSQLEMRGIKNLKNYIRSITKICNKIQKNKSKHLEACNDKEIELAQRLTINNLSFTEIQEEKIEKQKLYLTNFQHLRRNNSKMISTTVLSQEKVIGDNLFLIFKNIDRLYEILQEMEALGYYKKNNKSIINFCTNNKIWLSKIFLYESNSNKDAFSIKTQWFVVATSEQAKKRLSNFLAKGGKIDFHMIDSDVQELVQYLEQALGQKKLIEVSKVGDYIQFRLKELQFQNARKENIAMLRVAKSKPEECNFPKQLSQLEQRYGAMNIVTKVSRKRFQDLNRTYDKLKCLL